MASIFPTSPTLLTPSLCPLVTLANGSVGTATTVDLRDKFGMWVYARIGRAATTALVRPGYFSIRPTVNGSLNHVGSYYDRVSSVAACSITTISTQVNAGATEIPISSTSGFVTGDNVALYGAGSPAARFEIVKILWVLPSGIVIDSPLQFTHPVGESCSTMATVFDRMWIQGGDIWSVAPMNYSGQTLHFHAEAMVYSSDTSA